ncbi:outer membrane protein assembly factor BamB family protein [Nocardiopsis aegyptia]|uniref:Outer membrane protein assembly factor BamB n=1 Tax=Nocardiopsis aegyptia TaxID=220378 RepID=A0A7Z0JC04_9ACTN|nr:PQQ-binding-like beta-propeller repeat protein [Nocardiopsis aegyptia]NYJ36751.1 outer membrane protein assembly factor BamB [Nocardiopsis aegyptia]
MLVLLAVVVLGALLYRLLPAQRHPETAVAPRLVLAAVAVLVVLLCVPAWTVVLGVRGEATKGFVDFTAWGLALGPALVAVALALPALVPARAPGRRWLAPLAGVSGLALGAGLVALVVAAVELRPVDSTSAPAPETAATDAARASAPAGVSGVGWRWRVPEGQDVVDTVVAGAGAAVLHTKGVTLLDTRTGRERWRYWRADARATDIAAAPDGGALVVSFSARDHTGGSALRLVALDAATGRVRAEYRSPDVDFGDAFPTLPETFAVTADTFLMEGGGAGGDGRSFTAYDLDSGEEAWRFDPPDGCVPNRWNPYGVLRGEVVALVQCGLSAEEAGDPDRAPLDHDALLVGLDPADGSQLWRHEEPVTAVPYWVRSQVSPDGGVYALEWETGDGEGTRGNLFVRPGGEVAARDLADLRDMMAWEGGGTRTSDGFVTSGEDEDAGEGDERFDRYTSHSFEGEERVAAVEHVPSLRGGTLALADQLVVLRSLHPIGDLPHHEEPLLVLLQSWDVAADEESVRLEFPLGRNGDRSGSVWEARGRSSLYAAPGAVVVARPGALEVVGLQ